MTENNIAPVSQIVAPVEGGNPALIPQSSIDLNVPRISVPIVDLEPKKNVELGGSFADNMNQLMSLYPSQESFDNIYTPQEQAKRYSDFGMFNPVQNNEEAAAQSQSAFKQMSYGVAKGLGTAGVTFLESFLAIPDLVSTVGGGSMYKNSVAEFLDQFRENLDVWLPNYYSQRQEENPLLQWIPFSGGAANFWGDKIIKNLGFMVGAVGGAIAQDAIVGAMTGGVGEVPLIASQVGKASLWLSKVMTGSNKLERALEVAKGLNKSEEVISKMTQLGRSAALSKVNNAVRYSLSTFSAASTEAGIEAREGYRKMKEDLINEYKNANGVEPDDKTMHEIEAISTGAGNTRYALNLAILGISNSVQVGNLLKPWSALRKDVSRGVASTVESQAGKIGLAAEAKVIGDVDNLALTLEKGIFNKYIKPIGKNIFAEGVFEEGGQFAVEKGVSNYFHKKFDKKSKTDINDVMSSIGYGLGEQFGTSEGWENMFIGGLIGGIMHPATSKIQSIKQDKAGILSPEKASELALNNLRGQSITGFFDVDYQNAAQSVQNAKEMQEAVATNDLFRYKNAKESEIFNFFKTGVRNSRHDVQLMRLEALRGLSNEELAKFLHIPIDSIKDGREYIDLLINKGNSIKVKFDSINDVIRNPYAFRGAPKTDDHQKEQDAWNQFEEYKSSIVENSFILDNVKERTGEIYKELQQINPRITNELLGKLTNPRELNELKNEYKKLANEIQESLDNKDITRYKNADEFKKAKKLQSLLDNLHSKLSIFLQDQDLNKTDEILTNLLQFELSGRTGEDMQDIDPLQKSKLVDLGDEINRTNDRKKEASLTLEYLLTEKGYETFKEEYGKWVESLFFVPEEQEEVVESGDKKYRINHEYELGEKSPQYSSANNSTILKDPFGKEKDVFSTVQEAQDEKDRLNAEFQGDMGKVVLLGKENGLFIVEDSAGNVRRIDPELLKYYNSINTPEEVVAKRGIEKNIEASKVMDEHVGELPEFATNSSDINEIIDQLTPDGKYKFLRKMKQFVFRSTITSPGDKSKDYNKRSQHFFSNIGEVNKKIKKGNSVRLRLITSANEAAFGLEGLTSWMLKGVEMDYPESDSNKRLITAVFQEYDPISNTHYFIDPNGDRFDGKDFNKLVLSPMPTTDINYKSEGLEGVSRFQEKVSKAEQEEEQKIWQSLRKELFTVTTADATPSYDFTLSRGIGKRNKVGEKDGKPIYEQHSVVAAFDARQKLDAMDQLIQVNTGTYIPDFTGDNVAMPKGSVIYRDQDSYTFQILNNRKLNASEVDNVFNVLRYYADVLDNGVKGSVNAKGYLSFLEKKVNDLISKDLKTDAEHKELAKLEKELVAAKYDQDHRATSKAIIEDITDYLSGLLFYNRGRAEAGASPNEVYFSKDKPGVLVIAGKEFFFTSETFDANSRYSNVAEIKQALETTFTNVNNKKLSERKPFRELYVEDNELKHREWKSYQHFLLSDKYDLNGKHPDSGKDRSVDNIPFTTTVAPLDKTNTLDSNYEGKYAIIKDNQEIRNNLKFEVAVKKQEKPPAKEPEKKAAPEVKPGKQIGVLNYQHPTYSKMLGEFEYSIEDDGSAIVDEQQVEDFYNKFKDKLGDLDALLLGLGVLDPADAARTGKEKTFRVKEAIQNMMEDFAAKEYLERKGEEEVLEEDAQVEAKVEAAKEPTPAPVPKPAEPTTKPVEAAQPASPAPNPDANKIIEEYKQKPKSEDFDFRMVNANEFNYAIHDIDKSEAWFEKNIPFSFKRLKTLIENGGMYAFGRYTDMHAEWYDRAKKGTIEHEAFEGIWKSFTNHKERAKILKEFNSRSGSFFDHETGREIKYSEATPFEAKEQLAEELGQYVLDGVLYKAPKSTKTNFIARMFEDFVNWIKSILRGDIKKMFDKINTGYYKDLAPVNDFKGLEKFSTNKSIGDLSASQTFNIIRGTTSRVMQFMLASNRSLVEFDVRGSKQIKGLLEKVHAKFNESFNDERFSDTVISRYKLGQADPTHPDAINEAQYRNFQKVWTEINKNFFIKEGMNAKQKELTVEGMVREYLGTYGVKVTDLSEDGDTVSDTEAESASKKILEDAFTIDVKKNALASIKLLLGTIVDGQIVDGRKIEKRDKATNMPKPIEFGKTFSFISDNLKDFNTFPEKMERMREMALTNSVIRDILKRLKIGTEPSKLTLDDVKLRAAFNNTFGKQRPEAWVYYINKDGSAVFSGQNLNVSIRSQREAWADVIKVDAVNHGIVKVKADGTYVFNPEGVKREGGIASEAGMLAFLNDLGIEFTSDMRNKLSKQKAADQSQSDYDRFTEAVIGLYDQFHKGGLKDKDFSFGGTGQAGRFNTIAELYLKSLGISDSTYYNIEGKQQSQDVGTNFISKISNDINNSATKDELFAKAPHMRQLFRLDSWYMNDKLFNGNTRTRNLTLSADILQGKLERGELSADAITLASMTHPQRIMAEINANLNKFYYILVPADSKQEWVMQLDHPVTIQDFERGDGWDKVYDIFNNYYQTERAIAFEKGNGQIDPKYKSLTYDIMGGYEAETLDKTKLEEFISNEAQKQITYLKQQGFIVEKGVDFVTDPSGNKMEIKRYSIPELDIKFLTDNKLAEGKKRSSQVTITEGDLRRLFEFTEANYAINIVEFHKLFFGDPSEIKDPLKRYKSFMSPRQESLYGDQEFNDILNRELNILVKEKVDKDTNEVIKEELQLVEGEYGFSIASENISTFAASDQTVMLRNIVEDLNIYPDNKKLGDQVRDGYKNIDPTDGGGFTTVTGHREMTYRKGNVTKDHDKMYNYILADDRILMLEDGELQNTNPEAPNYYRPELEAYDRETVAKGYQGDAYLNVYKPIYSGVDTNGDAFLDKDSLAPLTYRMVRNTPLKKIFMNMVKNKIHYVVMKSGRKIGKGETYNFYNEDGAVNNIAPSRSMMKNLLWKYFGIQVETEGRHHHNALGTQSSTMVAMNLQNFGIPIDFRANKDWDSLTEEEKLRPTKDGGSDIYRMIRHNQATLNAMQKNGYDILLRKLGITEGVTEDGKKQYFMEDKAKLAELLRKELLQRDATQNQKDALEIDPRTGDFVIPLDAAANFKQIKQILYSKVEKDIAKIKQNGGPKVMVPGIMYGSVNGKEIHTVAGKNYLVSSGLKFYEAQYDKNGKRTSVSKMEVMITSDIPKQMRKHPRWEKATDQEIMDYLTNDPEAAKVLEGIGFRIPTQELNSIDSFVIKGFLPDYMGDTIIVPEAITTKAGSDFDIDKLNTYLKNVYLDKDGNVRQVPFLGTDAAARTKLAELMNNEAYRPSKETDEEIDPMDEEVLDDYGEDAIDKFFKHSIQNEYYDSMSNLILHPDNFERLIKPNSADKFKAISKMLERLAPDEFTSDSKGSLMSRMFMSRIRQAFVGGKSDVGIAASNQKNHSLNQLVNLFVDPDRLEFLPSSERKFLNDCRILLPHNTMMGRSTISGIIDDAGNYISDNLSQCIDGYVDIAKGAWIMNIVQDSSVAGTFMFMLKIGVPPETAALFMNQPIIREYMKILKKGGSTFVLRDVKSLQRKALLKMFPVGIDTSDKNKKWAQDYNKLVNKSWKNGFNIADFSKNISDYYNSGKMDSVARNVEQHAILKEFLKYTVMADHNFKIQQALTFDTNPDPDPAMQSFKERQVAEALSTTIFANVDKLYEQSHLGGLRTLTSDISYGIAEGVFKTGSRTIGGPREVINTIMDQYPTRMARDNRMRAASAAEEALIAYLVQTTTGISSRTYELLVDKTTNMAKRFIELRKELAKDPNSDLANNELFKELMVSAKKKRTDVKNIFLARKAADSFTMDMYTDAAREFRENPIIKEKFSDFYNDLIITGFLQSGLSNSRQAFSKIIPSEDWAKIIAPVVMEEANWQPDVLQGFIDSDVFFRNQWRNKYLTPSYTEKWNTDRDNRYTESDNRIPDQILRAWNKFIDENNSAYTPKTIENGGKQYSTRPGSRYIPFRITKNSKEGQYKFLNFTAIDAAYHNRQEDMWGVEDKKQMYFLKRVHDANDNPVLFMGDYIYVPISPRGDSVNAQEFTDSKGPSAIKTDCYNVPYEYPDDVIADFFEGVMTDFNVKKQAENENKGTMDDPWEFKVDSETIAKIERGDMTGITLPEKDSKEQPLSPNSIVRFTDGEKDVLAKAITGFYKSYAIRPENWARVEGKTPEEQAETVKRGEMQFLFRGMDPISGELVLDKSPAEFKHLMNWKRLSKKESFLVEDPDTNERTKEVEGFRIEFIGHPDLKLIAYEEDYITKNTASARKGWLVADEMTGVPLKKFYQNTLKAAVDAFIRTTNRDIEEMKNTEQHTKLNISRKEGLEKSEKSVTFGGLKDEEYSSLYDKISTKVSAYKSKEDALDAAKAFHDKLLKENPSISKENMERKIECYLTAPF